MPSSAWLTKIGIDAAPCRSSAFDLAIDASGAGAPSRVMAGLDQPGSQLVPGGHARRHPLDRGRGAHRRRRRRDPAADPAAAADVGRLTAGGRRRCARARRPGRLVLAGSLALTLGLAGVAAAWTRPSALAASDVEIPIHYSHYGLGEFTVPAGVPGPDRAQERGPDRPRMDRRRRRAPRASPDGHRAGPRLAPDRGDHPGRGDTRDDGHVLTPGTYLYICHLPGHEAYGMVGTVVVTGH